MVTPPEIKQMSREEKLKLMEAIWADLATSETEVESPDWHAQLLKETETRVATGEERIADWELAKKELRTRFE